MPPSLILTLISLGIAIWLATKYFHKCKQKKLLQKPLHPDWIVILEKNVALYSILPDELRIELHGHVQVFLDEKEFIGQGIQITDEIKLTIAGSACVLLLQGGDRSFPDFTSIIVYPDTYVAKQTKQDGLAEHQEYSARAGESWMRGPIVLSWKDVARGSQHLRDGHNVVLHEFAHKLDEQNNVMNGLPQLRDKSDYAEWTKVFRKEYAGLIKRAKRNKNNVLDEYGTVSPPEFFAVATESFFEKPKRMQRKLPDLYTQLKNFYNVDPASWQRET
ncbi:MAG: zinc-dependent peptidase [Gammaproteobacteria bacterium]